ncbi:hypothetical protein EDB85DRAFT_2155598 [Lactarius pseudohatsudake]|nr:hypothetical protein EDB85DRAFT_2155598 [Lactarius pseudohatsudake]
MLTATAVPFSPPLSLHCPLRNFHTDAVETLNLTLNEGLILPVTAELEMATQLHVDAPRHAHVLHVLHLKHSLVFTALSEHPDLGPIIPTLLSRNIFSEIGIIDIRVRFLPDDLPTETTCRSFSRLFASPICGLVDLAEEGPYNVNDVVVNEEGTNAITVVAHTCSTRCSTLPPAHSRIWVPTSHIDPGMGASSRIVLHPYFHHVHSEFSIPMLAQSN